jgi:hypothetical protein
VTAIQSRQERGFALILALMALVLLTTLGLTLAATTTTELKIATNYRWNQQAYYNAQAGLEVGKRFLRDSEASDWATSTDGSWSHILWTPRSDGDGDGMVDAFTTPAGFTFRPGPNGEANRSFELNDCDTGQFSGNGAGLGWVLDDNSQPHPFQNSSQIFGRTMNGTFTLWIRRPIVTDGDSGTRTEDPDNFTLILTAEGTAPYGQDQVSEYTMVNRAVRYLEIQLTKDNSSASQECGARASQAGSGGGGTGFDQCTAVQDTREVSGGIK